MSIPELVGDLRRRNEAHHHGDSDPVLDPEALTVAATLWAEATAAGEPSADVVTALCRLYWCRFVERSEERDLDDFYTTVGLADLLAGEATGTLPEPVSRFWGTVGKGAEVRHTIAAELVERSSRTHDPIASDLGVSMLRVVSTDTSDPDRTMYLSNLSGALQYRFQRTGNLADLDEAVKVSQAAVDATPFDNPDRAAMLTVLGLALRARAGQAGHSTDLDEAVRTSRQALDDLAVDHPDRVMYMSNLAGALQARFERTGDLDDLDETVRVGREAVSAIAVDHPYRAPLVARLGHVLRESFDRTGDLAALNEAVELLGGEAVNAAVDDPVERAGILTNLGSVLLARFDRTGLSADLDDAVEISGRAVEVASSDQPDDPTLLSNFANTLRTRFRHSRQIGDLDEAVRMGQRAVQAAPPGHPDRAMCLSNLGFTLTTRYEYTGQLADLDEAVRVGRQAVEATPTGHPKRAMCLSNLGSALHARFERTGRLADLEESVRLGQQTLDATVGDYPDRATSLSAVGSALLASYRRTGRFTDLDEAVRVIREALGITPLDHPRRFTRLANLSGVLQVRFEHGGVLTDLAEAVWLAQQAADGDDDAGQAMRLSTLSSALLARFERTRQPADLEEAIRLGQRAVRAATEDDPHRAMYLTNLGLAFHGRYKRTGRADDVAEAARAWSQVSASTAVAAAVRVTAARLHAEMIASAHGRLAAADVYEAAVVNLLPLLSWRGVERQDQQHLLDSTAASLGRDAAACAIAAGRHDRAVELLEQGRGVLWAQLLDIRTDLTRLTQAHPELADRLSLCRARLEQPAGTLDGPHDASQQQYERETRHQAAYEYDRLVAQIRALPATAGFPEPDQFLAPPRLSGLLPPGDGHIVIVIVSQWGCDALALHREGVRPIPLGDLHAQAVTDEANRYLSALEDFDNSRRSTADRIVLDMAVTTALEWLWEHIAAPVLHALGHTTTPTDDEHWPRIWWCPTGPLTALPIHAAGHHHTSDTVYHRVVSSYAPTLRALAQVDNHSPASTGAASKMLVVALPETPHRAPLPGATAERDLLASVLPDRHTILTGPAATRQNIIAALPHHAWLHAACHGYQDIVEPDAGGLAPYDWDAAGLVTVVDLAAQPTSGGELAFLSACNTATGGVANTDETITVAAALQHTGWRHVIATLWNISDLSATEVANGFYPRLLKGGILDSAHTAQALHHTVRGLRDRAPHRPSTWAPFLHIGP
ncbi:CHAT domain-containing protein [Micromonospora sp. NPDC050417]|uniref:CHAT domain-containing protein n=1 Tax=Micromonospora sp. NPDC050417 TaxID=3364280 RepID=UPI00378E87A7